VLALSYVGASVKRTEDARLVTGRGRYAEDWNAPGQVHAAFVRSPHAHADIVAIDPTPARPVPGVLAVFTGRDLVADGVGAIPTLIADRGGGIRNRDGSPFAEVPMGSQSQGQGHETVFAQVVAERLGVPFETVRVVMGDTDRVAKGVGTFASRSMVRGGSAAVEASEAVVALGKTMVAHLLEAAPADIEFGDGAFRVVGTDRAIGIFEVARAAAAGKLPPALGTTLGAARMHANPAFAFANGCEVCELEVDPETGAVEIVALTVVDDSGRSVNPMIVHGQQHGAVAQGIGQALIERCVYDPASGQLLSGSFLDYAILRADDLPEISVISRDVPSPTNPLGVKGAGEGGTVGAPGAVIHALLDALGPLGVAHIDMPATPERVWQAIQGAR
jgi:carbon-monoxide dehydrogenase large subunit